MYNYRDEHAISRLADIFGCDMHTLKQVLSFLNCLRKMFSQEIK